MTTLNEALPSGEDIQKTKLKSFLAGISMGASAFGVIDHDLTTPPSSPTLDDTYIIADGGAGAWSGNDQKIAHWDGSEWQFVTPKSWATAWVVDEGVLIVWTGSGWVDGLSDGEDGIGIPSGGAIGQILEKTSTTDYDAVWGDKPVGIPTGGTIGQIIEKVDGTNFNVIWGDKPDGGASQRDISILALHVADLSGDRINMTDGIVDPFQDETDVDPASTGVTYDAAGHLYASGTSAIGESALTVGASSVSGGQTRIDRSWTLINGSDVSEFRLYSNAAIPAVALKMFLRNGSEDYTLVHEESSVVHTGSGWESFTLSVPFSVPPTGDYHIGAYSSTTVSSGYSGNRAHKSGNVGTGTGFTESSGDVYALGVLYQSSQNADIRSNAFSANAQPSVARIACLIKPIDEVVVNTDVIASVSRDDGATWSTATLIGAITLTDGTKMYVDDAVTLSAQPDGTNIKWRVETANLKSIQFTGIVLQWS